MDIEQAPSNEIQITDLQFKKKQSLKKSTLLEIQQGHNNLHL